jgi:hypothetical protein
MKKRTDPARIMLALSAVAAGGILYSATASNRRQSSPPQIIAASTARDLGHTHVREEQRISFPIRNGGSRRLVLNEMDAGCGCGNPTVRTVIIPPGERREVTLTLDTRFANGLVRQSASFATNDPNRPRFTVSARAWVVADDPAR